MTGRRLSILLGVAALASFLIGTMLWNPLRRPTSSIRNRLLEETPLGTPRAEVQAYIKSQGWPDHVWTKVGENWPPGTVQATMGSYEGIPWRVNVQARWLFGADGKLVDIVVEKLEDVL